MDVDKPNDRNLLEKAKARKIQLVPNLREKLPREAKLVRQNAKLPRQKRGLARTRTLITIML